MTVSSSAVALPDVDGPTREALDATDAAPLPRLVSTIERIGPYRVVRQLGEGGMGTVYLAERMDGEIQRRVAIKVISLGIDLPIIHQRFLSERQILADLDHPSIARLYDAGTTRDGRPYFVMEAVDGLPIDRYCVENELGLEERLQLVRRVCGAVEHAHRRLVIHRDLKPSNILVTSDGTPKLLDFGIAKLLDPESFPVPLDEETQTAMRPLTPRFASPEQVYGGRITTASDVWSLGVLLYRILTGGYPYRSSAHRAEALLVSMRRPPEPASRCLRRRILEGRRTPWSADTGRSVAKRLRGDIDSILWKALRFEPDARYGNVSALDEDLRRVIYQEPVRARKSTLRYRGTKFARRHRWALAAAAIGLLVVLAFVFVTARQAAKLEEATRQAELTQRVVQALLGTAEARLGSDGTLPWELLLSDSQHFLLESAGLDEEQQFQVLLMIARARARSGHEIEALRTVEQALDVLPGVCRTCGEEANSLAFDLYWTLADAYPRTADSIGHRLALRGVFSEETGLWIDQRSLTGYQETLTLDDEGGVLDLMEHAASFVAVVEQRAPVSRQAFVLSRLLPVACTPKAAESESCLALLRQASGLLAHEGKVAACATGFGSLLAGYDGLLAARDLNSVQWLLGQASCSRAAEARRAFDAADRMLRDRLRKSPGHLRARYQLGRSALLRATVAERDGERGRRRGALDEALRQLEPLSVEHDIVYIDNSYAIALLMADRVDEARPLVASLVGKGWRRADLMRLAEAKGALPEPLPPPPSLDQLAPRELLRQIARLPRRSGTLDPELELIVAELEAIAAGGREVRPPGGARRGSIVQPY